MHWRRGPMPTYWHCAASYSAFEVVVFKAREIAGERIVRIILCSPIRVAAEAIAICQNRQSQKRM